MLTIAAKTFKEAFRQPKNLAITLGLPMAFMLIFGLAFGDSPETTFDVAVIDLEGSELSRGYVEGLMAMEYASGKALLHVTNLSDEAAAREGLARADYEALVVIPANFSEDALPQDSGGGSATPVPLQQPQAPPQARGARVDLYGNPSRVPFQQAAQAIQAYTAAFSARLEQSPPAVAASVSPTTARELTTFDYMAPGLMVFAILNIIPQAASALARESEAKTLDRVRMSPTRAPTLLAGVAIAQIAIASVSLALMFAIAKLMGFHNQGSYVVAYLVAMGAALAATGIGLVVAALARTQQEAGNFGALVSVPMSFLSGAFFPVPGVPIGAYDLYDAFPTTHAVEALRQVMTFGLDVTFVTGALWALVVLALVYVAAGSLLYARTRLRAA